MRNREKSASNFGGRPISPTQIEKSKVLAKNRRLDTSKIRDKSKSIDLAQEETTSLETSRSSERIRRRRKEQNKSPNKEVPSGKTKIRYKLPI